MIFLNNDTNFILGIEIGRLMNRFDNKEYVLQQLIHSQNKKQCIELAKHYRLAFEIKDWYGNEWCLFSTFGIIENTPKANDTYTNNGKRSNHYDM